MEGTVLRSAYHLLPVVVAAIVRQWSQIIVSAVKFGPTHPAECAQSGDIAEEPGRLLTVDAGKLALMPGYGLAVAGRKERASFGQLPNRGGAAAV